MPTPAVLTNGASTSNPASTASISPTADRWVYVWVVASNTAGGPPVGSFSVSGCGITWEQIGTDVQWALRRDAALFRGKSSSPSSGSLSITHTPGAGGLHEQTKWIVLDMPDADSTTPNGTVYENHTTSSGVTSIAASIGETPDANDIVLALAALEDNLTPSLNSELDNMLVSFGDSTGARRAMAAYDSAPDASPAPGFSWSPSSGAVVFGLIINAAAGGGEASEVFHEGLDRIAVGVRPQTASGMAGVLQE